MVINRLHSKLFEAAALDLDRRTRFHLVGQNVRPSYLKEIERDLKGVTKPDMEGELNFMIHVVESGPLLEGRFMGLKTLVKRILRPHSAHTAYVHRMIIQRLIEQNDAVKLLVESVSRRDEKLAGELEALAGMIQAGPVGDPRPSSSAAGPDSAPLVSGEAVAAGSKLMLGTIAVKKMGYVHFDPTAPGTAPLDSLPVGPGTMAEIVAANVLESYPVDEVRDVLLPYWATLLKPGGRLILIADDLGAAGDRFRDGPIDFSELASVLFGQGRRPRRSAYTPELLWQYVEEAGLSDPSVTSRKHRPESGAYGFELTAFRGDD